MKVIAIKGLTHKMKNRIREHGNMWVITTTKKDEVLMTPEDHLGKEYGYKTWAIPGKDFEEVVQ